jgi:hypothetical protein
MAATIAHETGNPPASAMNAIYLAAMDPSAGKAIRRNLEPAEMPNLDYS